MEILTRVTRMFDTRPWAAHLYLTDRCNLACSYCNEFDNDADHPATADLKTWLKKLRDLGVMRVNFLGGEPLLHSDVVELVRYARSIGFFRIGMSTNGLLLTQPLLRDLEKAGLGSLQISVDRLTPTRSNKKALRSVQSKLAWFRRSPVSLTVSGVISEDTLDEIRQVVDTCLALGVPVAARPIHDDLITQRNFREALPVPASLDLVEYQIRLKRAGRRIHTPWPVLRFQHALLVGKPVDWTCVAGYKYFFVSAQGKFWPCSQYRTGKDIMTVSPADLLAYNGKKHCQPGCGVYCIIGSSLMFNHPLRHIGVELRESLEDGMARLRHRFTARTPHAPGA